MVDLAAGPTTGGVILAFETARQLGVRGIFTAVDACEALASVLRRAVA